MWNDVKWTVAIIFMAMIMTGCATVDTAKGIVYDKAYDVGLAYCRTSDEQRQVYRDSAKAELAERAAAEPEGTMVPKSVTVECGPR